MLYKNVKNPVAYERVYVISYYLLTDYVCQTVDRSKAIADNNSGL